MGLSIASRDHPMPRIVDAELVNPTDTSAEPSEIMGRPGGTAGAHRPRVRLVVVALASLLSCSAGDVGAACTRHSDCRFGLTCGPIGACEGGVIDAELSDAPLDDSVAIPPAPPTDAPDGDAVDAPGVPDDALGEGL